MLDNASNMNKAGVIFDGDDTLWETMPLYTEAKQAFFYEMAQLGFNPAEVELRFESKDRENVSKLGFSKHRFPTSMADTYRLFCEKHKVEYQEEIEKTMRGIGYQVFIKHPKILDHADQVLAQLRPRYSLVLATKGDIEVQQARIEQSGLSGLFDKIFILPHKSAKELQEIVEACNLDMRRSWVVGNSLKSDINPALHTGLSAIWIPYYTWDYEEDEQLVSPHLYKSDSLQDAAKILMREAA